MADVRDALRSVAELAPVREDAFPRLELRLRRRERARRARLIAASLLVAAAGLTWALIGFGALHGGVRPAQAPVTRTATAQGVTVTFPTDWTLVELQGEIRKGRRELWPTLQLANVGPSSMAAGELCPAARAAIPSDAVLLYVQRDV